MACGGGCANGAAPRPARCGGGRARRGVGSAGRGCGAHHFVGRVGGGQAGSAGRVCCGELWLQLRFLSGFPSRPNCIGRTTNRHSSIAAPQPPQPHTTMVSGNRAARPSRCRPPRCPARQPRCASPHAQPRQHSAHRPAALTLLFAGAGFATQKGKHGPCNQQLELHPVFEVRLHLRTLSDHRPHLVLGH